ncbi:carboxylesterase 3-like [Amblyomma americanum]
MEPARRSGSASPASPSRSSGRAATPIPREIGRRSPSPGSAARPDSKPKPMKPKAMRAFKQPTSSKSPSPKRNTSKKPLSAGHKPKSGSSSPAGSFKPVAKRPSPESNMAKSSESPNAEPPRPHLFTAGSNLPFETWTDMCPFPEDQEVPFEWNAENDIENMSPETLSAAVGTRETPSATKSTPGISPIRALYPMFLSKSSSALAQTSISPKSWVAVAVSIIVILAITTLALMYLWPRYRRQKVSASLDPWANIENPTVTNLPACVDPSLQLALALPGGTVFGFQSAQNNYSRASVRQFFGIRYGASTAGKNRFGPAVSATTFSANGTFNAYAHGPPCAQLALNGSKPEGSEDCLTLSIWAPFICTYKDPPKKVVVALASDWFHTGRVEDYEHLWFTMAADGDIVVVALNVRLGVLGYLSSPSKTAPGNVAFTDVSVALSWIRANIATFHGNSTAMVALGFGGGGLILSAVFLSSLDSQPYFQQLILHGLSPTSLLPRNGMDNVLSLAERLACSDATANVDNVLSCLRSRNWEDVVAISRSPPPLQFVPSRDVTPLTFGSSVSNAITQSLQGVSILCGYNEEDSLAFVDTLIKNQNMTPEDAKLDGIFARVTQVFASANKSEVFKDLSTMPEMILETLNYTGIRQFLVDAIYHCPLVELAIATNDKRGIVYFYISVDPGGFEPKQVLTEVMTFAKEGVLHWPPFGVYNSVMVLNGTSSATSSTKLRKEQCRITREVIDALVT